MVTTPVSLCVGRYIHAHMYSLVYFLTDDNEVQREEMEKATPECYDRSKHRCLTSKQTLSFACILSVKRFELFTYVHRQEGFSVLPQGRRQNRTA